MPFNFRCLFLAEPGHWFHTGLRMKALFAQNSVCSGTLSTSSFPNHHNPELIQALWCVRSLFQLWCTFSLVYFWWSWMETLWGLMLLLCHLKFINSKGECDQITQNLQFSDYVIYFDAKCLIPIFEMIWASTPSLWFSPDHAQWSPTVEAVTQYNAPQMPHCFKPTWQDEQRKDRNVNPIL